MKLHPASAASCRHEARMWVPRSGYPSSMRTVSHQDKIFPLPIVMKREVLRALTAQPDHPAGAPLLGPAHRLDEQLTLAQPPEMRCTGRVVTNGDARFQHGTSSDLLALTEGYFIFEPPHPAGRCLCNPRLRCKKEPEPEAPVGSTRQPHISSQPQPRLVGTQIHRDFTHCAAFPASSREPRSRSTHAEWASGCLRTESSPP